MYPIRWFHHRMASTHICMFCFVRAKFKSTFFMFYIYSSLPLGAFSYNHINCCVCVHICTWEVRLGLLGSCGTQVRRGGGSRTGRLAEEIKPCWFAMEQTIWLFWCNCEFKTEDWRVDEQQKPLEQSQNLHFNIFKDAEVKSRPLWYLISACTPAVLTDITVLCSGLPPKSSS